MCLRLYAIPAIEKRVGADRLSKISLSVKKVRGAFHFSDDGGCSCGFLSEEADLNEPMWALRPELLERLAVAPQLLGKEAAGFTFEALWAGDHAVTKAEISLSELLQEIRSNRIRNKHTYLVGIHQPPEAGLG
jgi:hypothetical protein